MTSRKYLLLFLVHGLWHVVLKPDLFGQSKNLSRAVATVLEKSGRIERTRDIRSISH
jgi:hypothetical protein